MQVVVLTDGNLKEELFFLAAPSIKEIVCVETLSHLQEYREADVFIDLLFKNEHTRALQKLLPKLIIVNSVTETLAETHSSFVRINGWPTFLKSPIIEASSLNDDNREKAEQLFSLFNKKLEWQADITGFITPRIISMIINEAFIALREGVSTKEEIDTAMKLGTNYPYGPFEWAQQIGIEKIKFLLDKLSRQQTRYNCFVF